MACVKAGWLLKSRKQKALCTESLSVPRKWNHKLTKDITVGVPADVTSLWRGRVMSFDCQLVVHPIVTKNNYQGKDKKVTSFH